MITLEKADVITTLSTSTREVPLSVVAEYMSGDYPGVRMADVFYAMQDNWEDALEYDNMDDMHPADIEWGGPRVYCGWLAEQIRHSGVIEPLETWVSEVHSSGLPIIRNGHHRFVAAMLLGLDSIPVMRVGF